jgi:hypothetical protein
MDEATLAYMRQVAEAELARLCRSIPSPADATFHQPVETDRGGEPSAAPTLSTTEK